MLWPLDLRVPSDDYSTFRKVYENPILKSRAPECTSKEIEIGEARSNQVCPIILSLLLNFQEGYSLPSLVINHRQELCFTERGDDSEKLPPA